MRSNGQIDLESMDSRHGLATLLDEYGPKVIYRLGRDPIIVATGANKRGILIDRVCRNGSEYGELREISWANVTKYDDHIQELPFKLNEPDITEQAAIGVVLLLASELEGLVLKSVLQIGSGGDYLMTVQGTTSQFQMEVSGIRQTDLAHANGRVRDKKKQVKKPGFVSVTTFGLAPYTEAHSFLHFSRK